MLMLKSGGKEGKAGMIGKSIGGQKSGERVVSPTPALLFTIWDLLAEPVLFIYKNVKLTTQNCNYKIKEITGT